MNAVRWIFGVPLALLISGLIIVLFSNFESVIIKNDLFNQYDLYYHGFVNIICSSIFVFLSCLFVPSKRKYAMLLSVFTSIALIGTALYLSFTNSYTYGEITIRLLISYGGVIAGLLIGIYASYEVFKSKGWHALKNSHNDSEVY